MIGEHLKKKSENYFHFLDRDGDGWITFEDFSETARNIQKHGQLDEKRMNVFHEEEVKYWTMFEGAASEHGGRINQGEFVDCLVKYYYPTENLQDVEAEYNKLLFDFIDRNGDGEISFEEFFCYYKAHNWSDRSHVMNIFNRIDTNDDGFISREEFTTVTVAYWTSDDPDKGCAFMFDPKKD